MKIKFTDIKWTFFVDYLNVYQTNLHTSIYFQNHFLSETACTFHKQLYSNGKLHIELNVKFWSRKNEKVFSCKTHSNNKTK